MKQYKIGVQKSKMDWKWEPKLQNGAEREQNGAFRIHGNNVGSIPTSLTCRIEDFYELSGFSFDMSVGIDSPRSPGYFGFEYTKQKYIECGLVFYDLFFGRASFLQFKRDKWREASTRFERERFFEQAEAEVAKDGGYFGTVSELTLEFGGYPNPSSGITGLHVLGDLFDFDEPAIDISREEDDISISSDYSDVEGNPI